MPHELVFKNGLVLEGNLMASGSLEGTASYAFDDDKWIYNDLLGFLKAQMEKTRSIYQIPGEGIIDDFVSTNYVVPSPWTQFKASSILYNFKSASFTPPVTTLLCHFDSILNTTQSIDSGPLNLPMTGSTGMTISSGIKKYGPAAGQFGDIGTGVRVGFDDAFNFAASESFTVEMWMSSSNTGIEGLVNHNTNDPNPQGDGWRLQINGLDQFQFVGCQLGSAVVDIAGTGSVRDGNFHHLALVRSGSVNPIKLYVDGVKVAESPTDFTSLLSFSCSGQPLRIGINFGSSNNFRFTGIMDDLRIVKGWAVYSQSFTPPSSALPNNYLVNATSSIDAPYSSSITTLSFVPDKVRSVMVAKVASGSFSAFTSSITRDGTTYVNMPFVAHATWSVDTLIYSSTVDLRPYPSGKSFGYKLGFPATPANQMVIEGIAFDFE